MKSDSALNLSSNIFEKILPHLLLNYSFHPQLGLLNGKMGGVIFFNHYARYSGNELYDDYAGELFDELYDEMFVNAPIDLENGLCGIGWGIEYLVQNEFTEGNTDEILEEIDAKIMERNPLRIKDLSLKTGLGGLLYYALMRLSSFKRTYTTPFDANYLVELQTAINQQSFQPEDSVSTEWIADFNRFMNNCEIEYGKYKSFPDLFFEVLPEIPEKIEELPLGLKEGLTGIALKQILS